MIRNTARDMVTLFNMAGFKRRHEQIRAASGKKILIDKRFFLC